VQAGDALHDFDYYLALRRLHPASATTTAAVAYSRVWSDFARRALTARALVAGAQAEVPPSLALPALLAYAEAGQHFRPATFLRHVPEYWDAVPREMLAGSASWLAELFNPADPSTTTLQVWCRHPATTDVGVYGRLIGSGPPPPLWRHQTHPLAEWLAANPGRPVAVIAHYDVHGLSMLALTLRFLRRHTSGDIDTIFSFELTGDIGKLWKRTLPSTIASERSYSTVIMIDCSVDSRRPGRTLKALSSIESNDSLRVVIVDHHQDTFTLAPQVLAPRVDLVLADVFSCGLTDSWEETDTNLMALGAIGDKVPEVTAACTEERVPELYEANGAFHRRMIRFSPTPKEQLDAGEMPLKPLWQALANGEPISAETASSILGPPPAAEPLPTPQTTVCGSLLIVTARINAVGRTWYALLERLMNERDLPYAAALRVLDDKRANILLLTRWQATQLPPVRYFIPERFYPNCLGHPAAQWVDLEKGRALEVIREVAANINANAGTPADFAPAAKQIDTNLLSPRPASHGPGESEQPPSTPPSNRS